MRISFDCVAELYDKSRGLPKPVMRRFVKALVGQLEGYQTILDAGVGTGRLAGPLQNSGFFVVGVDIVRRMIERAGEKRVENLIQGMSVFCPSKRNPLMAQFVHMFYI